VISRSRRLFCTQTHTENPTKNITFSGINPSASYLGTTELAMDDKQEKNHTRSTYIIRKIRNNL